MQDVLVQVNAIVRAKPEDTAFARPLQHFPASVSPSQQSEIRNQVLTAIRTQVQPAYVRFAKYLSAEYIPQSRKSPGIAANSDVACSASSGAEDFDAGRMRILELRESAEKALGNNFNLSEFRDAVQASSFMPSDVFEKRVKTWIAQQQKPQ
jgi:uncharacterized protein (DUF885 family)